MRKVEETREGKGRKMEKVEGREERRRTGGVAPSNERVGIEDRGEGTEGAGCGRIKCDICEIWMGLVFERGRGEREV